jgi:hypothetical protein
MDQLSGADQWYDRRDVRESWQPPHPIAPCRTSRGTVIRGVSDLTSRTHPNITETDASPSNTSVTLGRNG